ncbi:glucosaminidase domain-containing protein [Bradyrhizobium sp. CB3481]|uniref:glucosaminidase domain-containing protein n=1 Tax=Bradyrhizobium sp. CB3481 TaxID=3039158 RepID=UPI0024B2017E|nr:glucosaminidase domain-containing protein [Bradyrhizobium sp. CB3481]WFU14445.1 N-acetylmuramoyl-L-alanine amidase [Bradyrhizobium sp. CB3481]
MSDTLDIIEAIRSKLRDAFAQATDDEQKQKIKNELKRLADLQEEVVLSEFETAAAEIQALTNALQRIIDNLNGVIANFFIQDLNGIGTRAGLPVRGPEPPRDAGTPARRDRRRPPQGSAATPPASGNGWSGLIAAYRGNNTISNDLKVASLAQWIQESGRGTSRLARDYNNFGGLKYRARMQGYCTPIDYTGTDGESTTYCNFSSPSAFIEGYWHFIASGDAYSGWEGYNTNAAAYIRFIAPNYSADPNYVTSVLRLFDEATSLLNQDSSGASGRTEPPPSPRMPDLPRADGSSARVAIVIGHNARSPGSSAGSPLSRTEFTFNSEIAAFMQRNAAQYNIKLQVFTRQSNPSVQHEIMAAYEQVAAFNPVCAVELHFNSSDDATATGSEVLLVGGKPAATALASSLVSSVKSALGLRLRGNNGLTVVSRGGRGWISVSALPNVPSVLCEPFFGSNPNDCLRVAALGEDKLALAYLRGLREFVLSRNLVA